MLQEEGCIMRRNRLLDRVLEHQRPWREGAITIYLHRRGRIEIKRVGLQKVWDSLSHWWQYVPELAVTSGICPPQLTITLLGKHVRELHKNKQSTY